MNMRRTIAGLSLMALLALPAPANQKPGAAEAALRTAMDKERIDGDLKAAVTMYRKIIADYKDNRAVVAKALLRFGHCSEKLGEAEARKSYEQLVKDYADQKEAAAEAGLRLAAMSAASNKEVRARLLWDKAADLGGKATADGRFLSYTDWDTGDLAVRDLVTGQSRRVTNKGGYDLAKGEAEANAISPDGKRIAFTWIRWDNAAETEGGTELRCVDTDGKNEKVLLKGTDLNYVTPGSWSPDMKWIAVQVLYKTTDTKIVLLSPDGAPSRTLLTLPQRRQGLRDTLFSPDGRWLAFGTQGSGGSLAAGSEKSGVYLLPAGGSASEATEIATDATLMGWVPGGKALLLTREYNGVRSLYLQPIVDGKAAGEAQPIRSEAGIGRIFLGLLPPGTLLYGTYKRTTEAVTMALDPTAGTVDVPKVIMPVTTFGLGGLSAGIRYSPDGKRVLYTTSTKTLLIRSLTGDSEYSLMPQMERIGRIEWAADSNSLYISGAARNGEEGVYQVDSRTGVANFLFGGKSIWLLAASPDGKTLFYKGGQGQGTVVSRDLKSGSERKLMDATAATFDLKVSRDGKSLAVVGFRYLRIIDTATGELRDLHEPSDVEDSRNPAFHGGDWSADGERFFMFASIDNGRRTEFWSFLVQGGEAVKQKLGADYRGLWISRDGKQLATVRWEQLQQVWSLENFLPK